VVNYWLMQVTGAVAGCRALGRGIRDVPKEAVSPCTKPDMVNARAQESWSVEALIGWRLARPTCQVTGLKLA